MVTSDRNPMPQVIGCLVENRMSNADELVGGTVPLNNNVFSYEGVHVIFTDYGIIVRGYRTEEELVLLSEALG